MRTFLRRITRLTPIAVGAAAGMIVIGVVSIVGGTYDHQVVRDQLAPQKIFFPKPAVYPALKQYAGQQVVNGDQARLFANEQLAPDINKIAGGKTYSQVSSEWIAGGEKSEKLAGERTTLFMGETLKGLLLNAWGWTQVGSIAILAGILLIIFGSILSALPLLNWMVNMRGAVEGRRRRTGPLTTPRSA